RPLPAGARGASRVVASPASRKEGMMDLQQRLASRQASIEAATAVDPFAEVKNRLHLAVIGELGPQLFSEELDEAAMRQKVIPSINTPLAKEAGISHGDRQAIAADVADDILGHGPLERLLADDSITEIMVTRPHGGRGGRGGRAAQ